MANQLEHANIRVKNIDETIKFLTTGFNETRRMTLVKRVCSSKHEA